MKKEHTFVVLAYKESEYLENCIQSVVNQTIKTNVVIATSTPNNYISSLAKKYKLEIIENKGEKGIANDFNFAVTCVDSELVTVAHQDDIYEKTYAENITKAYKKYKDTLILYTDYYEIRNNENVYNNKNLIIKKILLFPTRMKIISNIKFIKRNVIRFGNAICCPSVTFCTKNITNKNIFENHFTCNMDWSAWEKISKMKGRFIYVNKPLMGHRVHEESTTTKIINDGIRTKEDLEIFCRFWPKCIAKVLNKFYKKAEDSNNLK